MNSTDALAADRRWFDQYIRVNALVTTGCSVGLIIVYFTLLASPWIIVDATVVLSVSVALYYARRLHRRGSVTTALGVVAAAIWTAVVVTTTITPFVLPVTTPVLFVPVLVMVPALQRRELLTAISCAVGVALMTSTLAVARLVRGPQEQAPRWLINAILVGIIPVVLALLALIAWQNHLRLAGQAGELRESRARVVSAADHERRRIEQDLHDGAQQQLAAIAIRLGLVGGLAATDPTRAAALAGELTAELHDAIAELRRLAHGIYPALLAEQGLVPALRTAFARLPVEVTLDSDRFQRRAADIEAALYFSCLEAVHNSIGHGAATSVDIVLSDDVPPTCVIGDNGCGFDWAAVSPGAGLRNIADRAGAVGGWLQVDTAPGAGTRLLIEVPTRSR